MIFNLSDTNSVANQFIAELRDVNVQKDRMRFRSNMERIGSILAYEISKSLTYHPKEIETPLGIANTHLSEDQIVLATILRAGIPLHEGMLQIFDKADNAFVSAYRKHHKDGSFEINLEYISCPNLEGRTLILADAMLATGASMALAAKQLSTFGTPSSIHFVTAVASSYGLEYIRRNFPQASIWMGALDEELTAKSYIVPGLGDAGDLSYGAKVQE
jgi:uracil phosphoribosyltransferase